MATKKEQKTQEVKLRPIRESTEDYERLEAAIKQLFRREIYLPLLKAMGQPKSALQNARTPLKDAIASGRISYDQGRFEGRFNASISKELRALGAKWDKTQGSWNIPRSSLPLEVRESIDASLARFEKTLASIDRKLAEVLPEQLASQLKSAQYFDTALWKVDRELSSTMKNLTVFPELTHDQRHRIAEEWQDNMKIWIKDFTQEQIQKLRKDIQANVFSGNRYESFAKVIQRSYGVTENKAKFLARQETALLMAKHKEVRYQAAGVKEYRWGCVAGSKNHPVRPWHKSLEGKIFTWDNPPITTEPGQPARRNNPGQDYNCRCFAQPIVRF